MNILDKMQEMTMSLDVNKLLANRDEQKLEKLDAEEKFEQFVADFEIVLENRIEEFEDLKHQFLVEELRQAINVIGQYDENSSKFEKLRKLIDDDAYFFSTYEDVAKKESYEVKILFDTIDEDEVEEDEVIDYEEDEIIWEEVCCLLYDIGAENVRDYKLAITCTGDKELEELEKLLEEEHKRFYIGGIITEYGPDGSFDEPIKNKDL